MSNKIVESIIIRVNGVLIEDNKILLVEQYVTDSRHWAHPGGRPEFGETLEHCIIREMKEETGLDVSVDCLLYVTDRIQSDSHVVIISFQVSRKGGELGTGTGPEFATGKIKSVRMVPFDELHDLGFSADYCNLVKSGFPKKGAYRGNILD
jgi:ADP-ribose pyrophosphatase YjhB (NUDIX family)